MFDDLYEQYITETYNSYKGLLIPSVSKQLGSSGLILDLDSLPTFPYPFKELFIRWLISVNRLRLEKGLEVLATKAIVMKCPIWKIIKCPLKNLKLTQEAMFNKPRGTIGTIGTKPFIGSINKK